MNIIDSVMFMITGAKCKWVAAIHTFELYYRDLKYTEVQKAIDFLMDSGEIWLTSENKAGTNRHFRSDFFVDNGIRLRIDQTVSYSNGIGFIITPAVLLKKRYGQIALWAPKKSECEMILDRIGSCMTALGLEYKQEELSLCEMDLTLDVLPGSDTDMKNVIRIFRKSRLPKNYTRRSTADPSYWYEFGNRQITVKVYDKIRELTRRGGCPDGWEKTKYLRIEASLKRKAFLKLPLGKDAPLYDVLKVGGMCAGTAIAYYLDRMFPSVGRVLRYEDAREKIRSKVEDDTLREQMLFLLKKTSDSAGLDAAVRKLKDRYTHVDNRRLKKLFAKFDELDVNPITFKND